MDILNFLFEKIPEEKQNKFDKICELFNENIDEK